MTMTTLSQQGWTEFLEGYASCVLEGVRARAEMGEGPEWFQGETSSVLNGLMARQASLTLGLVEAPSSWTGHIAPLILRAMIDCLISFRWILRDPKIRSQEFIGYGLGQAKLAISHLERRRDEDPDDEAPQRMIDAKLAWIKSQRLVPFVDVNLGSWSGSSVRKMAQEAGDEDLYHFSFTPFSSAVHSTWEHVHVYNTEQCDNALHRWHRLPQIVNIGLEPDYVFRSSKYMRLTFESFDVATDRDIDSKSPTDYFYENIEKIFESSESSEEAD